MAASYSAIDDPDGNSPDNLQSECKDSKSIPSSQLTPIVIKGYGNISSDQFMSLCGPNSICIIPDGLTLQVNKNINVGALIVRGKVEWTDITQADQVVFLCAGFVAIEESGIWDMNIQTKASWIYIKDNGAVHEKLRSRSFGGTDNSMINIKGKEMTRTWSLLAQTISPGDSTMKLLHNPNYMNWNVGDRIAIAPTEKSSYGTAQSFKIMEIDEDGTILLDQVSTGFHQADFIPAETGME
eukprot:CAMPEP_0197828174 /NCGR_PEP_ID=MMETSP1437-20131217/4814_1 /TAXON_ID=49252 ORGANISM="Eucampia antarctica, Strain CCMP1452" /NCGR_SAMPLE_ID=MMETSP1437 /ASSEMBLY_ACC=CAM_ASM_001096 /LENGTH=239 /DNA_ID=CAMNT_0043429317 /DNA_START=273 /DNA_END=989 /DNA_ORIENTATION=+